MRVFLYLLFTILLASCSTPVQIQKARLDIPFRAFPTEGDSTIYLWPPYTSAAIIDKERNRCILGASGAQTAESKSDVGLKLGDLMGKLGDLDVKSTNSLVEAFVKISAADSRAAFVDISLFHLCIFDMNGTFSGNNMAEGGKGRSILEAYKLTITEAAKLVNAGAGK